MANEQRDVGEVGDPRVYFLRIDMNMPGRTPEECDTLAQKIGTDVFRNFRVKDVAFISDVELKKMFGTLYQDWINEQLKNLFTPPAKNETECCVIKPESVTAK